MARETTQDTAPRENDTLMFREGVIRAVQSPLGLFTLVILVAEVLLGAIAGTSDQATRATISVGMTVLLVTLVVVVGVVAVFRPEALGAHRGSAKAAGKGSELIPVGIPIGSARASARLRSIVGRWSGEARQQYKGAWVSTAAQVEFREVDGFIRGYFVVDHPEGPQHPTAKMEAVLTFFYDPFIKLDYKNCADAVLQFGCWVAELKAGGEAICGRFVGYGDISQRIIHGEFNCTKSPVVSPAT